MLRHAIHNIAQALTYELQVMLVMWDRSVSDDLRRLLRPHYPVSESESLAKLVDMELMNREESIHNGEQYESHGMTDLGRHVAGAIIEEDMLRDIIRKAA